MGYSRLHRSMLAGGLVLTALGVILFFDFNSGIRSTAPPITMPFEIPPIVMMSIGVGLAVGGALRAGIRRAAKPR